MAGVVLAAGESSRMGRPKALVQVGDRTMLQRAVDALLHGGVPEVVVVLGAHAGEVVSGFAPHPGVRTAVNTAYRTGRSGSLRLGLAAMDAGVDAVVVMLCDQPHVTGDAVRAVVDAAAASPRAEVVVARYDDDDGHPVLLRRAVWPRVRALRGDVGARAVFAEARVLQAPVAGPAPRDVDTPEDLAALDD